MSSKQGVRVINPQADVIGSQFALQVNINAAKSLQSLLASNLGPNGTMKMLVGGAGQIKITKDGKVLLDEMQIQHPTAALIARTATAQDDITGDGTTSIVLLTAELLKMAERHLNEGLHPRVIVDGFEKARDSVLQYLDSFAVNVTEQKGEGKTAVTQKSDLRRDVQLAIAKSSCQTKVERKLANHLAEIVTDAVNVIWQPGASPPLNLHMVEIMHMRHKSAMDTRFIPGLVLDHGTRHPNMAKRSENCFILTCNVSLEYEKTQVNSGFVYGSAEEREALAVAERKFTDDKVNTVIQFAQKVIADAAEEDEAAGREPVQRSFVVINLKGIDPISLDMFQKAGIVGIRRAKKRNMERLARACGGYSVNSVKGLSPDCLGFADLVYEHVLGDDKYTFVEGCKNPSACTILIRGPNDHTIRQVKDCLRDGLRAVKNVIEDGCLVPGAGAFEAGAHIHLTQFKESVKGRAKLGVQAFADAMLVIPKTLADNSGLDGQEALINLVSEAQEEEDEAVGLDLSNGKTLVPAQVGIWDSYRVKKQQVHLAALIANKLLLVDEVMRAGRKMGKN